MHDYHPMASFAHEQSMRYDAEDTRRDEEQTVAFLARLAGQRNALELAVGTGRIALPLAAAGVSVDGIEMSPDMVARMREKPGGDAVEVTMGDMSRVRTGRTYGLVYLVYNTIGNLLAQDDQVRCFENAARHLTDDGVFVLECQVPAAPSRAGHQFVASGCTAITPPLPPSAPMTRRSCCRTCAIDNLVPFSSSNSSLPPSMDRFGIHPRRIARTGQLVHV
ncbi:MAG: class I SAM-dependent DNA methyltransferase [Acidimicrobiales bacterium]